MSGLPRPRIGLALGSGAARGWAHLGVLRALTELGVSPDIVCGTSIGALAGGLFLGGHLDALETWARSLTKLRMVRYVNLRLARNGLIAADRLFAEMEQQLGDMTVDDLPLPFVAIATDLHTGSEVWLSQGRLVDCIRASFCLPAFFTPTEFNGRWLIDGALVNPVPVSVCRALGADIVIAVNLNANGFVRKNGLRNAARGLARADPFGRAAGAPPNGTDVHWNAASTTRLGGGSDAPNLLSVMASTLNIVQDRVTRSRLAADPPDINIVPKVGHIGLLDFHRAAEIIEAGRNAVYLTEALLDDVTSESEAAAP